MLGSYRVRKRRELFRVDAATARGVVEAVAGSLPVSTSPLASLARSMPARPAAARRYRARPMRLGFRRYSGRRVPVLIRVVTGIVAIICWFTLVQPQLANGWLFGG